jgi:hypothetical protein
MLRMFAGASNFNQPLDKWPVSSLTDTRNMFSGTLNCAYNEQLPWFGGNNK